MALTESQNTVIIVSTVIPALAVIALLLRVRARSQTSGNLKADDYWIVVATVITVAGSVPYIVGAAIACIGVHLDQCPPKRLLLWGKIAYMIEYFYIASVSCAKISVLLFYRRTFGTSRHFIHYVHAALTAVVLWAIAFSMVTLLQRWPIATFWDKSIPTRWHIDETKMLLWSAITDIFLDVVTLLLPLPMIYRLKMTSRDKLALAGVFVIGLLAPIAGAVRLVYALQFRRDNADVTFAMRHLAIWSSIEPSDSILAACLPLLHPIFKRHAPEDIVRANTGTYDLLSTVTSNVYQDPRDVSIHMGKVDGYHDNVIE